MRFRLIIATVAALAALPPSAAVGVGVQRLRVQAAASTPRVSPLGPRVLPVHASHASALRAAKAAAARRRREAHGAASGPGLRAQATGAPRAAVFNGLNQPGLNAADGAHAVPPDTTGSIGPSFYVEMVNSAVAVYRRGDLGRQSGPVSLEVFMHVPSNTVATDPQIQWDEQGQRWYYLAAAFTPDAFGNVAGPNYTIFGFSKTTDPSDLVDGWCRYSVPAEGNLLPDFPKLGHDNLHLLFGMNLFDQSGSLVTAQIQSVPKPAAGPIANCPSLAAATGFGTAVSPLTTSDGNKVATPVPANTADSSNTGYIVAADDPLETATPTARNQIMAWHMGGTGTAPALLPDGNVDVSPYTVPASARQPPPGAGGLDTLDGRLTTAVAHADPDVAGAEAVWTQHTIDPGNGSVAVRWYEVLPASRAKRQEGTISDPQNDVFNGSASPTARGNAAAFFYNVSSLTLLPEMRGRGRSPSTALGDSDGEVTLGVSTAADMDASCFDPTTVACRWGDYSGASPDQSNPDVVWGSNQGVASPDGPSLNPSWFTRNYAVMLPPPIPPGGGQGGGGGGGNPGGGPPADHTPPSILAARLTRRVFAVDPRGRPEPAVSARARRGTTIAYTLSKPARVLFTIEQAQKGRRVGRTCQRPSRRNRGRRACTRFVRVGSFAQNGTAGRDRKAWSGKIGTRALKPGPYRLSLTARDAAGNVSTKPRRLSFVVVRR